jgi:prepilin-type N-terminal cleavage/methylation domain-containing protein
VTGSAEMTKQSVIRYIVTSLHRTYGSTTQRVLGRGSLGEGGNSLSWRSHLSFFTGSGFTLIELIVVVTIIVILAGLVLSTVGYVQKKAARSRAETEIAAMSAACESYKADNGVYPFSSETNTLNARTDLDPSAAGYSNASLILYEKLMGVTSGNRSETPSARTYMSFKPNQLSPADQSHSVQFIRDPFGNSYGYSTANQVDPANGYNPTFDLWSTAGVAPSPTPAPPATQQDLWIKNW